MQVLDATSQPRPNPVFAQMKPNAATDGTGATGGTGSTSGSSSTSSTTDPAGGLANETTFLQLLVAQIQNQDPLNPTDTVQFVGQLCQFSQLEQLLGINQGIQTLVGDTQGTGTSGTQQTNGSTSS